MLDIYNNPLVSIIVPVYNVEYYLDECVTSIINQKYKNLEIILVDDGSTDRSGILCDDFASHDMRIKVIHKKNGGLSDARNAGLEVATGEYIGFVDSDDYIENNMYYELLSLCKENDAMIASARWSYAGGKDRFEGIPVPDNKVEILNPIDSIKSILISEYDKERFITFAVWNRLYHRSILAGLKFPVGKCYEDIVLSCRAILRSNKLVYINKDLYHYRVRSGSITDSIGNEKYIKDFISGKLEEEYKLYKYLKINDIYNLSDLVRIKSTIDLYYVSKFKKSLLLEEAKIKYIKFHNISLFRIFKTKIPAKMKLSYVWNRYLAKFFRMY